MTKPDITLHTPVSHNFGIRTDKIKWIICHHTDDNDLQNVLNWFCNPNSSVSAHFVIDKDGTIYQVVATTLAAWHCRGFNHNSIGIECVSKNEPLTDAQDQALQNLVRWLMLEHNISPRNVSAHRYMPDQHTLCPGNLFDHYGTIFNWVTLKFPGEQNAV